MLTGDDWTMAEVLARKLGIDEIHADVLLEGTNTFVLQLRKESRIVVMTGDGVTTHQPWLRLMSISPGR